mmetsp:Transcript_62163/g.148294  ORF Transcript_62163/g.148294 Transcript_62163/m.148294 type:complete len:242 (-) Transcript_62163:157-882(-)
MARPLLHLLVCWQCSWLIWRQGCTLLRTLVPADAFCAPWPSFRGHASLARPTAVRAVSTQDCVEDCIIDLESLEALSDLDDLEGLNDEVGSAPEPWEEHIDRITFEGGIPDASDFRAPSPTPTAYTQDNGYRETEASEALMLVQAGLAELWDVRSLEEFELGHPEKAKHVPFEDLERAAAERINNASILQPGLLLLVCGSGMRSAQAQVRLTKVYGLEHVSSVKGGLAMWEALGGSMETEP